MVLLIIVSTTRRDDSVSDEKVLDSAGMNQSKDFEFYLALRV